MIKIILITIFTSSFLYAQSIKTRAEILSIIGKENSFVFDHYQKHTDNDQFISHMIKSEKKHKALSREKDHKYRKLRRRYLAHSLYQHFKVNQPSRSIASISSIEKVHQERLKYKIPQYLGMIFFKKNEIKKICKKVVDKAVKIGSKGIAFFYPVHYSGGNSKDDFMPNNPTYGIDYKYEYGQVPLSKNVFSCLDYIRENDLEINWVPHLESISSLASSGTVEWRMYSGIPLDKYYYAHAFGPLFHYIKSLTHKNRFINSLKITFAAEIDNMALGRPKDSIAIIDQIKSEMKSITNIKVPILLNTNGDFFHMWKIPQVNKGEVSCSDVSALLDKVDILSPSMYGDKGHFKLAGDKLSLSKSINHYYSTFVQSFPEECMTLKEKILGLGVGFGEFALDMDRGQKYKDILKDPKGIQYIQYWNHSKWDHLGILSPGRDAYRNQLINTP